MSGWQLFFEVLCALAVVAGALGGIGMILFVIKHPEEELFAIYLLLAFIMMLAPFPLGYWSSGPAWVFVLTLTGITAFGSIVYRIVPLDE